MKTMKRVCALALLLGVIVSISGGTMIAKTKIKLNTTSAELVVGKSLSLKVKGTKKKVTWKTSNKDVATVSKKE